MEFFERNKTTRLLIGPDGGGGSSDWRPQPKAPPPSLALAPTNEPKPVINGESKAPAKRDPIAVRQRAYTEKYDKLVVPKLEAYRHFVSLGADFAKTTVSYLILGNAAGLAALLAIFPFIREMHQQWLLQQIPTASFFGIGLFLAGCAAAASYYNYMANAHAIKAEADQDDTWLKRSEFDGEPPELSLQLTIREVARAKAHRDIALTFKAALVCSIASAGFWSLGAFFLLKSVAALHPM